MLVSWSQPLHILSLMLLPLWNYMTTCLIYRSRSRSHSAGHMMLQASPSIQLNLLSLCHLHHEIFHVSLQALKNHLHHYSTGPSVIIFCNGILLDITVIITPTISCQHGSTSINVHITCLHHHAVVHLQWRHLHWTGQLILGCFIWGMLWRTWGGSRLVEVMRFFLSLLHSVEWQRCGGITWL